MDLFHTNEDIEARGAEFETMAVHPCLSPLSFQDQDGTGMGRKASPNRHVCFFSRYLLLALFSCVLFSLFHTLSEDGL